MAMGNVPTAALTAFYNNTEDGTVADPAKIDAAVQAIVQTINDNYAALISAIAGSSGAQQIGSAPITGVTGSTVYAQLAWIEAQIQSLQAGSIPAGSITNSMLQNAAVSYAKLDTSLKGSIDVANKFRDNNGIAEFNDGTGWVPLGGSLGFAYKNPLYASSAVAAAATATWYTAMNVTGKGYIDRAVAYGWGGSLGSYLWGLVRITIDGVVKLTCRWGASNNGSNNYGNAGGMVEGRNIGIYTNIGRAVNDFDGLNWNNVISTALPFIASAPTSASQSDLFIAPGPMFFNTSLKIEVLVTNATGNIQYNVRGGLA